MLKEEVEKMKNEIEIKENQRTQDEAGNYRKLMDNLNDINKEIKTNETKYKNLNDSLQRELKENANILSLIKNNETLLKEKEKECIEIDNKYNKINEKYEYYNNRISTLESQQLGIGMKNNNNDDNKNDDKGSLTQQLMEVKRLLSEYDSQLTNCKKSFKKN